MSYFHSLISSESSIPPSNTTYLFRADSGIVLNGSGVASWTDSIGGLVASQSTPANQPVFSSNAINSQPVVIFNGTSSRLDLPIQSLGNTHTICLVWKNNNILDIGNVITGIANSNYFGKTNQPFSYECNSKQASYYTGIRSLDYTHIVCVRAPTGTPVFYENGYTCAAQVGTAASFLNTDVFSLNGISNFPTASFLSGSNIAELRIYNRALNINEISQWNVYVNSRYKIPSKFSFPKNVITMGDSHTSSDPTTNGYPVRLRQLIDSSWNNLIIATGGSGVALNTSDIANNVLSKRDSSRIKDIVIIFVGTNDIATGTETGSTLYTKVVTNHTTLRNAGFKTMCVTLLPRTGNLTVSAATYESERVIFNNLIINNHLSFSDAIADFTNDINIGINGASNNTTYFQGDKIHLTVTGRDVLVNLYIYPQLLTM